MKRAHLGTTIRSIGLGGVAALAISPLALVTPAQAGTPVAAAASSASVQSGRPDPAYTPTERRAAIIQAKQERAATANLSFYLRISSSETTTSTAYDTLKVQVISGGTTTTLATYSNLHKDGLRRPVGQPVRVHR